MKEPAYIDYEWNGKRYRYQGEFPEELFESSDEACDAYNDRSLSFREAIVRTIEAAGGKVIAVFSPNPDGSITSKDLPDYEIY